ENITAIVKLQLGGVKKMLEKQQITLEATDEAVSYLAKRGYDPQYGARPVKRTIQKEALNALSKEILAGKIQPSDAILLDCFEAHNVLRKESIDKKNEMK